MFGEFARWVWINEGNRPDEYASFKQKFTCNNGKMLLKICAESNYIAYVNGKRAGFGQFAGYVNEKYYDELDITNLCKEGENELTVTVWSQVADTSIRIKSNGGLIFCISEDGKSVGVSGKDYTLGGIHTGYVSYLQKVITPQLGYSSTMNGGENEICYGKCVEMDLSYNFLPRPVKKLIEHEPVYASRIDIPGREIYDLGRETAGYAVIEVECSEDCTVKFAYGEHLKDGCVRYLIGPRDFSLDFNCKKGNNYFEQLFVRVAGRYIEIFAPETATVKKVGVIPVDYPQEEKPNPYTGLDGKIYEVSVRTLRLCMHEHYEDCPWREQALYVLDSRNQMLCGYYAFKDSSFQRANLVFISKGKIPGGLLELTYPAVNTPAIPFFSVMYPVAVWEYIEHTGDKSILNEVMGSALEIMQVFKSRIDDNGLIACFKENYWNFYEWSDGSAGQLGIPETEDKYDLIINCAFIYSYERFKKLCDMYGAEFEVDTEKMKNAIVENLYDKEKGIYKLCTHGNKTYGQLGNAFAKLIGLTGENLMSAVKGENVVPATLSMMGYVYDALLTEGDYRDYVLEDIRKNYKYMLDNDATSFWETILGEADFDNAGSLCHGWSAMPIYYFNKLLG